MDELSKTATTEDLEAYKNKLRIFVTGLYLILVLSLLIRATQWVYHGGAF